jgi:hypothetical protein
MNELAVLFGSIGKLSPGVIVFIGGLYLIHLGESRKENKIIKIETEWRSMIIKTGIAVAAVGVLLIILLFAIYPVIM